MSTPAEDLRVAANVVRERGWCRGVVEDYEGHVCAVGAINVAVSGMAYGNTYRFLHAHDGIIEACAVMGDYLGVDWPADWNNNEAQDGDEVAAVMEKAAAAWEESSGL